MDRSRTRLQVPGFQVVEYLGSGARSTIWRVRERRTNRLYALKRVLRQPGDDDRYLNQAINEYNVSRQLDHPAVRKCYRLRRLRRWFQVTELHLLMEMCEGESCQANRPTELAETLRIFMVVGEALSHMHARGYIHADIKPNNIIVAADGTVKIIDFGQSCPIGTIKERIQGTPDFISPEQVHRRPLDVRTDVFNFGATLYWTLTGQAIPTILPKKTEVIQLRSEAQFVPADKLNPEIPGPLARLLESCVEPVPSRRPASVREVLAKLDLMAHTLTRGNGQRPAE